MYSIMLNKNNVWEIYFAGKQIGVASSLDMVQQFLDTKGVR